MEAFTLCTFSKSEVYKRRIAVECPLGFKTKLPKGVKCSCEMRLYHVGPNDLRVLSCTFPRTWNGKPIENAEAFAAEFKRRHGLEVKKESKPMATETGPVSAEGKELGAKSGSLMVLPQNRAHAVAMYRKIDPAWFIANVGKAIAGSCMFGCSNVEQGQVFALTCLLEGITPMEIIRTYHMLGGKLTMRADAMLAEFEARGGEKKVIARTPETASIQLIKGKDKQTFSFTWAEAWVEEYVWTAAANSGKAPKLMPDGSVNEKALKDNWSTPRRRMQMLWARVISDGVRAMDPGVVSGTYAPEEFGEIIEDVIDAEFREAPTAPKAEATEPPKAPQEPVKEEPKKEPTVVDAEIVKPEEKKEAPVEKPKPAAEEKSQLSAEERTALHAKILNEEFVPLKRKLFPMESDGSQNKQYESIMAKFGVASAKALTLEDLQHITQHFKVREAQPAPDSSIEDWIDAIVLGRGGK